MTEIIDLENIASKSLRKFHGEDVFELLHDVRKKEIDQDTGSTIFHIHCNYGLKNGKLFKTELLINHFPVGLNEDTSALFEKRTSLFNPFLTDIQLNLKIITDNMLFSYPIYSEAEPNRYIVYVDDNIKFDTVTSPNLTQQIEIMKSLAKIHAASSVVLEKCRDNSLPTGHWLMQAEDVLSNNLARIIEKIDSWSDNNMWANKLRNIDSKSLHTDHQGAGNKNLECLSFGDIRSGNISLRYRGCGTYDVKFLNAQEVGRSSIYSEIMYFIFTSVESKNFKDDVPILLENYFKQCSQATSLLSKTPSLTYEEFYEEFKRNIVFGFHVFQAIVPVILSINCSPSKITVEMVSRILEETNHYEDQQHQQTLIEGLSYFEEMGLF